MSANRVVLASDHAAILLKGSLGDHMRDAGYEVVDLGPLADDPIDYPLSGYKLAEEIAAGRADWGVALCGSGIGISIAVNRNPACRCALVSEPLSARLARQHNDANVIAMGGRLIGIEMAKACVDAFLATTFAGAEDPQGRHQRRVDQLSNPFSLKENA